MDASSFLVFFVSSVPSAMNREVEVEIDDGLLFMFRIDDADVNVDFDDDVNANVDLVVHDGVKAKARDDHATRARDKNFIFSIFYFLFSIP